MENLIGPPSETNKIYWDEFYKNLSAMIDVLYYMYYLFYLKKLKDEEPHARTIWFLGIFFSYWVFCAIDLFLLFYFLYSISLELALTIFFLGCAAVLLDLFKKVEEENLLLKRGSFLFAVVFVFQLFGQYSFL